MIKVLAMFAVIPMATGPLPQEERSLVAGLCDGGTITIPLRDDDGKPDRDCHQLGCHAGTCRERLDRDQGKKRG